MSQRFTVTWSRHDLYHNESYDAGFDDQSQAELWAHTLITHGRREVVITDNLPDSPITIHGLTSAQVETIRRLSPHYRNFADWAPPFDLPKGWVSGWAQGVYYGIDPEGQAHS